MTDWSHIPSNHKCFQAFSQHGAVRRGAFRPGAHGDPRLRRQEDRGGAWCAGDNEALATGVRSDGNVASRNIGRPRGAEACYLSRIPRIVMCASRPRKSAMLGSAG